MTDELIDNYSQDITFTLGYAGTGKSTLLAKEANKSTLVLTPTHKAKEVLLNKGVENVFTIHSVLKLVPIIDMNFRKKGKLQRLRRIGNVDLSEITTIIIDEFSMIPTHVLDKLMELLPEKAKVSIYGDPYQLPPIDGDPIDPYWYTAEEKITTLTTQHRSDAPEVVETFTRFVHYLECPSPDADLTLNKKIKKGKLSHFNPATDRALAYTNAKTIEVNNEIAKLLDLPETISIGETVSINGILARVVDVPHDYVPTIYPKCISKGKLMEEPKLQETITAVEKDIAKYNQSIVDGEEYFIEIEDTVYRVWADTNHYEHDKSYKSDVEDSQLALISQYDLSDDVDLKDWCRNNRNSHTVARGKAWSKYLAHQNLVWDIRRPYATTIHKAQGSEFSTIYLAQDDIKQAIRGDDYTQYARLMYVALSRAIKRVVVIK